MIRVVKYRGWVKTIYVAYIVSLDICGLNALFRYTIQVHGNKGLPAENRTGNRIVIMGPF